MRARGSRATIGTLVVRRSLGEELEEIGGQVVELATAALAAERGLDPRLRNPASAGLAQERRDPPLRLEQMPMYGSRGVMCSARTILLVARSIS